MNSGTSPASSTPRRTRSRADRGMFAAGTWVLVSAWCSLSGWGLSLCGRLETAGYAASFLAGGLLLFLWMKRAGTPPPFLPSPRRLSTLWYKRFRKPLPFLFLAAALLTLVAGSLYAPVNYDALTYRLPRVLHWIAEGRWHWIDSLNDRMNFSGTGFEWLMTPLLVFTRSDRFLFLANFLPFLLLPSVTFCCLREMGARARVAWFWMWLLPLAHGFVLQAGGIGNDYYAATYLLAAIALALRAARCRSIRDLWISAIAVALVAGSKVINLPLLLPYAIAAWPARGLLMEKKAATLPVLSVCLAVSFLPTALLNQRYSGAWAGDPGNMHHVDIHNPPAAFAGNALQVAVHNFEPPVLASAWNGMAARLTRTGPLAALMKVYTRLTLESGELPEEEGAGVGAGISLLFIISLAALGGVAGLRKRGGAAPAVRNSVAARGFWIALGAWIALGIYMAKVASESAPRLVAAYYPLCLALALLHPGNAALTRRRWWRIAAALASLSIFPALILNPSRPLWPAVAILRALAASHPQSPFIQRADTVYEVYSRRADVLSPLISHIPAGEKVIAFLGGDDPSASLWRPYGSRRVVDFFPASESRITERYPGIYLVASRSAIAMSSGQSPEEWISAHGAQIIAHEPIIVKIHRGAPEDWYVLQLGGTVPAGARP